jgi:hypothetical protein
LKLQPDAILRRARSPFAHALELCGCGCVVYGIWLVYIPAALVAAGVLAAAAAYAVDRP